MKKTMLALMLAIGIPAIGFAQDGQRPEMAPEDRARHQTELMTNRLSLSDEQQKLVYEVNLKSATQMKELREKHDREGMQQLRADGDAAFKKILTAGQYQQYEAMKQQRAEHRREHRQQD